MVNYQLLAGWLSEVAKAAIVEYFASIPQLKRFLTMYRNDKGCLAILHSFFYGQCGLKPQCPLAFSHTAD